jgi:glyoxylase-like metal-dependent hydrolase (beta-lactamase superfamily II)
MHPAERDSLPARIWSFLDGEPDTNVTWLQQSGVPEATAIELTASRESMQRFFEMAEPDVLLDDGDLLPFPDARIRAVWTPGHTPGHLCLYEEAEDVLLTGDHILPRITPNIGVQPQSPMPPLSAYLTSLSATAAYDSAEALPAHEYRFEGIAERTRDLRRHHQARCQEVIDVLADGGPATAWQVTERLTWSRGWAAVAGMMRRAALAETIAHLDYLIERHLVVDKSSGPNEPARYLWTGSTLDDDLTE